MNYRPTEDHAALIDAVHALAARELAQHRLAPVRHEYLPQLQQTIAEAGFFDALSTEGLGPVPAADVVMALSHLPLCVESAASCLVAPLACPDSPGPFALVGEHLNGPVRFLPVARTLIRVRADRADYAELGPGDTRRIDSTFAYPMGVLQDPHSLRWIRVESIDPGVLQNVWRVALAAEIAGCLDAALQSVVQHVKDRRQFGRPLGAFQAIQHRLAEAAVGITAARWLVLRAAGSQTPADAHLATGFAQDIATRVSYDLHQFMGAMGLTLEHPLHRWTYRVKLLRSELGGAATHLVKLADAAWPAMEREAVDA